MRKSSINRTAREVSHDGFALKYALGRRQLRWLLLLLFPAWSIASGQSAQSAWELASRTGQEAARRVQRDQWFARGRSSPGEPAATLRYRAHLQKLKMRAARSKQQRANNPLSLSTAIWSPLGPLPLASDASGVGQYDYGWVSGRATLS